MYVIRKDLKPKEIIKLGCTYLFAGIIMFAVTFPLKAILGIGLKAIVIQVVTGIIVYVFMLWLLKDEYLNLFINKGKAIIGRK